MKFHTTLTLVAAIVEHFDHLGVADAGSGIFCGREVHYVEIPNSDVAEEVTEFLCECGIPGAISLVQQIADRSTVHHSYMNADGTINTYFYES